jgi:DNA modification methylase
MGSLYFGDNLNILRDEIKADSVDLIYLDPPFNSKKDYNLLFKTPKGHVSDAQIAAFEDTWHWGEQAEREFNELLHQPNTNVAEMIAALRRFLKENDMMAYLVMMANRLVELHRVLKPTGSLYLHCDPTASHYLRIVLDAVFDKEHFKNEIIWQRTAAKGDAQQKFGAVHDVILAYVKSNLAKFTSVFLEVNDDYLSRFRLNDNDGKGVYRLAPLDSPNPRPNLIYTYKNYSPPSKGWRISRELMESLDKEGRLYFPKDPNGRIARKHYLSEQKGRKASDVWTDITPLQACAAERLGYPTQKPLELLERIIQASSSEGDIILDPFCGCGTAIHAAQILNRNWIGIDITHLAISIVEKRMKDAFPDIIFQVYGTPKDLDGAKNLGDRDKYQFQWWACSLVNAQPYQGKKKGADTGIDGLIFFQDDEAVAKKIIVSVKGGANVSRTMIADLKNTIVREKAEIGLFVTLAEPTKPMITEAVSAGFYESKYMGAYPKIQILTIEHLLTGMAKPNYPDLSRGGVNFKKPPVEQPKIEQEKLI